MRRSTRLTRSTQSSQEDSISAEEQPAQQKKKSNKIPTCKPSQWVAVLPEILCKPAAGEASIKESLSFIALPDPKTGSPRQYLIYPKSRQICEVQKCTDEPRSWFIGDSVQTDGSLLVCTPVDPLFLALPYLFKAAKGGKFTTLDVILDDTAHINTTQLENYVNPEQWNHVSDLKVLSSGTTVYRYNLDKTMHWLRKKVEVLAVELEEQQVHVGAGSHSSTLVRSRKQDSVTKNDNLMYACGMICEYLNKDIATTLSQSYNLKRTQEESIDQPPLKKQRTDSVDSGFLSQQSSLDDACSDGSQPLSCTPTPASSSSGNGGPLEDYTKYNTSLPQTAQHTKVQAPKQTQAQKALSKVNKKGMKSISSFFGRTKT